MRQVTFVEMAVDYPLAGSSFILLGGMHPPCSTIEAVVQPMESLLPMMLSLHFPRQAGALLLLRSREALKPLCGAMAEPLPFKRPGVGRVSGLHHRVGICGGRHPGWRRCGAQLVQLPGAAGMSAVPLSPLLTQTRQRRHA